MYNLFIAAYEKAWDKDFFEFERGRFLEYTNTVLAKKFSNNYEELKKLPCLFGYENYVSDFFVGKLISVKDRDREILIEFKLNTNIGPLTALKIKDGATLFDIREWESHRTHWALKDENLFERLLQNQLITESTCVTEKAKFESVLIQSDSNKVTVKKTLGTFINEVFKNDNQSDKTIFYRGHSKKNEYKLLPSLFRTDNDGNYKYLFNEALIFREMLIANPDEFQDLKTTLDILIKMQHYSLPTRLLDITSNPLIALYFASKSNYDAEGEVIIFKVNTNAIKYFDSDTVSCLTNLSRLTNEEQTEIDLSAEDFNEQLSIKKLLHFIREEKPFFESKIDVDDLQRIVCVKGKHNNNRITSQSGAFFLFGLNAKLNENGNDFIEIERITIRNKKQIIRNLDQLNINESTVFPYIENSAKFIAQKYETKQ